MPLTGVLLSEPLPQERLAPVGQLPVGALDLVEELDQFLVTGLLSILEIGGAGFSPCSAWYSILTTS